MTTGPDRLVVAWMLGALVVTFVVTRLITRLIRAGRGPFKDMSVGGVHLHHQVFGIFLLLGVGALEIVYRPLSPWQEVIAVLFGVGAALTLDEFALWFRLDDVYWGPEGRRSVDAVLIAVVIGVLLLVGLSPFDDDASNGQLVGGILVGINVLFTLVAVLKGRTALGVVGLFVPVLSIVAALRLARPGSPWGHRFYAPGSRRLARAERRFPAGQPHRWDPVVDLFAGRPDRPDPDPGT
jgi:hypothetical protein